MKKLSTISFIYLVAAFSIAATAGAQDFGEPEPPAPAVSDAPALDPAAAAPTDESVTPAEKASEAETPAKTSEPAVDPKAPAPLDAETLRKVISSYIENDMKLKGGFFLVYDAKYKRVWKLHEPKIADQVRILDDSTGVACVIATSGKGATGQTLDVDVFVSRSDAGEPAVSEIRIHKSGNRERYWYDADNEIQTGRRK